VKKEVRRVTFCLDGHADLFCFAEERRAYEIVGLIIRRKAALLTASSTSFLFALCGICVDDPTRSVVVNTLATQHILLDFRIWRGVSEALQKQHLAVIEALVRAEMDVYNLRKLSHKLRTFIFFSSFCTRKLTTTCAQTSFGSSFTLFVCGIMATKSQLNSSTSRSSSSGPASLPTICDLWRRSWQPR
jgi:hypothetical protein